MSNVLLCGDLILDSYRHLTPTRICPEAPVPVYVQTKDTYETRGGVGLVQAQLEEFLGKGSVTTVVGSKSRKERLVADGTLIGRIDFDSLETFPGALETTVKDKLLEEDFDLLIISDYGKGAINPSSAKRILKAAKQQEVAVLVDSKHIGLWYDGAFAFFPNEHEGTVTVSGHCIRKLGPKGCVVDGLLIPSIKEFVGDTTGCGDIFLAAFAAQFVKTPNLIQSAEYANLVAGLTVPYLGTHVVTQEEVNACLYSMSDRKTANRVL